MRVASCVTVCAVAGATSSVTRASAPSPSIRPLTRGMRISPTRTSRDAFRSSIGVPATGASARGTKSTGTNQARPSRAGGAGNDTSRPATDTISWLGDSRMVWFRTLTVSAPAAVSSLTVRVNTRARSSSANISCPLTTRTGSGCRPSRETTV